MDVGYDRAAGLAPLDHATHRSELRIWSGGGVTGIVDGLVFTPGEIRHYSNEVVHRGVHLANDAGVRLVQRRATRDRANEVIQAFAGFAHPGGQHFSECRVGDTVSFMRDAGFDIEGRIDGRSFAFRLAAPRKCPEPRIRELWRAVDFATASLEPDRHRVGRAHRARPAQDQLNQAPPAATDR